MGKYVQWITHNGVRILFLNGNGLEEAEYLAALDELEQELLKSRTGPPMLFDLTKTSMTQRTTAKAKEMDAAAKEAGVEDGPGAVVGLSKLARMVAQVFGRKTHYFDTVDQAKEWLAAEMKKSR
jgi:membrane protease subunit (stomatin/prohibitin family)